MGLLREGKKQTGGRKRKAAIDLAALKRAQDQAASAGERIPMLDDLEDSTKFFSRTGYGSSTMYSDEAQQEAIDLMTARADAPRANASRQRLIRQLEDMKDFLYESASKRFAAEGIRNTLSKERGGSAEFVRIALEVANNRGLRTWKSAASGQQTLSTFLKGNGISLWVLDLLDATMDHVDGLKWNEIDESRKRVHTAPESQFAAPTPEEPEDVEPKPEEELTYPEDSEPLEYELEADGIRDRYADVLLEILKSEGSKTDETILSRLDKLAGIA
jgi:hypothetical protein